MSGTTLSNTQSTTVTISDGVRRAGVVCLVAGLLGAGSGVIMAVLPGQVPDDRYSYPLTAGWFVGFEVWLAVQHVALIAGLLALGAAGVRARGRTGRWGLAVALAGMALLTVTELLAAGAADATYPSSRTDPLDALYAVSSFLVGAGLVAAGIAVLRGGRWRGWRAWVVLLLGVYVFVPMTPSLMGPFVLARLAIAGWMLLFGVLGYALWRPARR